MNVVKNTCFIKGNLATLECIRRSSLARPRISQIFEIEFPSNNLDEITDAAKTVSVASLVSYSRKLRNTVNLSEFA